MSTPRRSWQDELEIIDRTMKAISGVTDPEELVEIYWNGINQMMPIEHYLSLSRRNLSAPWYIITRSSRFTEHFNPWTQRDLLPRFDTGLLSEIAYANKPVLIDDLPSRLKSDDPAHFYLQGYQSLVALPHYEDGESINFNISLFMNGHDFPRELVPMLHWQGGLFGRGTQNLVLRNQLASALATLDRELETVGEIQKSLLPAELPKIAGFDLAAFYRTSARAGGDYYDFFPLANDCWGIFIADVSGHGTPAAVLMAITHAIAHAQPGTHTPPPQLLQYLNQRLSCCYTREGTFITAFYAVLDPHARTLTYASAGHNPPRLVRDNQIILLNHNPALPLGIIEEETYGQTPIQLHPGDLLLLYTDGITETPAPRSPGHPRDLFGTDRLDQLLRACTYCNPKNCIARIQASLAEFSNFAPPNDDQTLIAMRAL
ncbi:MAG TPA: PP2C family protein-serine/threonine phosphatase [Tepidisphaeraceae bacterium]|jgi:sigma-B regulation protein RsbU (phosphoserine phosphatase)